jgi:ankyrin repeat protein
VAQQGPFPSFLPSFISTIFATMSSELNLMSSLVKNDTAALKEFLSSEKCDPNRLLHGSDDNGKSNGDLAESEKWISQDGASPLMVAAHFGHVESANLLLSKGKGINANLPNNAGMTALHIAVRMSRAEVVKILLSHPAVGANLEENENGNTAFMLCLHKLSDTSTSTNIDGEIMGSPDADIFKMLVSSPKLDINRANAQQLTPLMAAVKSEKLWILKAILVARAANIDFRASMTIKADREKMIKVTALEMAAQMGEKGKPFADLISQYQQQRSSTTTTTVSLSPPPSSPIPQAPLPSSERTTVAAVTTAAAGKKNVEQAKRYLEENHPLIDLGWTHSNQSCPYSNRQPKRYLLRCWSFNPDGEPGK